MNRKGAEAALVSARLASGGRPDGPSVRCGHCGRLPGVRRLQEPVAGSASAAGVQPPPKGAAELVGQALAQLLAHVGHGRPLQRQRLLARQPTELETVEVAAAPGSEHRAGGRLRVHAEAGSGAVGPGPQLHRQIRHKHQLMGCAW